MNETRLDWKILDKCNYTCEYCPWKHDIKLPSQTKEELRSFISSLDSDIEIYLFGGEPFLHPRILDIIEIFNDQSQIHQIQTNFSNIAIKRLEEIPSHHRVHIALTVHQTQISIDKLKAQLQRLKNLPPNITIDDVVIMYMDKNSFEYYKVTKSFDIAEIEFHPVINMGEDNNSYIDDYIDKSKSPVYSHLYNFKRPSIEIEGVMHDGNELWRDMERGTYPLKGKECLYKGDYACYTPSFEKMNCPLGNMENNICTVDLCPLICGSYDNYEDEDTQIQF